MSNGQNHTLALVMILLVVLMFVIIAPIRDFIGSLFSYRHVQLDLNPINPNFDPSTLVPKITLPTIPMPPVTQPTITVPTFGGSIDLPSDVQGGTPTD